MTKRRQADFVYRKTINHCPSKLDGNGVCASGASSAIFAMLRDVPQGRRGVL
ncbi:MAG: hypothetical protein LBL45_10100 [Treponema sp.]|nr:hypothetical protein [Treponema sp.]